MYYITIPYFNLNDIYNTRQSTRWVKILDDKYVIFNGNKYVYVEQIKDRLIFNCTTKDFYNVWWNYFDFKTDYCYLNNSFKKINNKRIYHLTNKFSGVHILNQDLWEVILLSHLGDNYVMKKQALDILLSCSNGVKKTIKGMGKFTFYSLPTSQQILDNKSKLEPLKSKKGIILYICECVLKGELELNYLKQLDYNNSKEYLQKLAFSKEAIDKILLHGLGFKNSFPVSKAMKRYFKTNLKCNGKEFKENFLTNNTLKQNKGLLYEYFMLDIYKMTLILKGLKWV